MQIEEIDRPGDQRAHKFYFVIAESTDGLSTVSGASLVSKSRAIDNLRITARHAGEEVNESSVRIFVVSD